MATRRTRVPTMANPITCEVCRTAFTLTKPTEIDISFAELRSSGWEEYARTGVGMTSWAWRCPRCKYSAKRTGMTGGGLTTGRFMPEKGGS